MKLNVVKTLSGEVLGHLSFLELIAILTGSTETNPTVHQDLSVVGETHKYSNKTRIEEARTLGKGERYGDLKKQSYCFLPAVAELPIGSKIKSEFLSANDLDYHDIDFPANAISPKNLEDFKKLVADILKPIVVSKSFGGNGLSILFHIKNKAAILNNIVNKSERDQVYTAYKEKFQIECTRKIKEALRFKNYTCALFELENIFDPACTNLGRKNVLSYDKTAVITPNNSNLYEFSLEGIAVKQHKAYKQVGEIKNRAFAEKLVWSYFNNNWATLEQLKDDRLHYRKHIVSAATYFNYRGIPAAVVADVLAKFIPTVKEANVIFSERGYDFICNEIQEWQDYYSHQTGIQAYDDVFMPYIPEDKMEIIKVPKGEKIAKYLPKDILDGKKLLIAPTGSGKTYGILSLIRELKKTATFAVPTISLGRNVVEQYGLGQHFDIENVDGELFNPKKNDVAVVCYQGIKSFMDKHVLFFGGETHSLIVDEFHNAITTDYNDDLREVSGLALNGGIDNFLAITATPTDCTLYNKFDKIYKIEVESSNVKSIQQIIVGGKLTLTEAVAARAIKAKEDGFELVHLYCRSVGEKLEQIDGIVDKATEGKCVIKRINSTLKNNADVNRIVSQGDLTGVDFLITTDSVRDGVSFTGSNKKVKLIVVGNQMTPMDIEQMSARHRGCDVYVERIITEQTGKNAQAVTKLELLDGVRDMAVSKVEHVNAQIRVDGSEVAAYQSKQDKSVRINEICGQSFATIDEMGVSYEFQKRLDSIIVSNNEIYKNTCEAYGFVVLPDLIYNEAIGSDLKEAGLTAKASARAEKELALIEILDEYADKTAEYIENEIKEYEYQLHARSYNNIATLIELKKVYGEDRGYIEKFLEIADGTRKHTVIREQAKAYKGLKENFKGATIKARAYLDKFLDKHFEQVNNGEKENLVTYKEMVKLANGFTTILDGKKVAEKNLKPFSVIMSEMRRYFDFTQRKNKTYKIHTKTYQGIDFGKLFAEGRVEAKYAVELAPTEEYTAFTAFE